MSLNIKSKEAHQLAQELAELTGQSMTQAVTEALREQVKRVKRDRNRDYTELLAIAKECAAHLKEPWKSIDHAEMLYDELGLPK